MDYFEKYAERLRVQGSLTAQSEEERIIKSLRKDWELSPSFRLIYALYPNGEKHHIRIQTAKKTVGTDKIYIHPDDRIVPGVIIFSLQEYSWLVTKVKFRGHVFQQANISRINRIIKYIDDNNAVKTIQGVVRNFSRVDGIDEYYYFNMPENTLNLLVPLNAETMKWQRDKRLMIDKIPYTISKIDNFTYDGVTVFFLMEDIRNPNDTDEIADYEEPVVPPTEEFYISGPNAIPFGMSATYQFVDSTNAVLPAEWSLLESVNWATLVVENNIATIQIKTDVNLIGKTVTLKAIWDNQEFLLPILVRSLV